MPISPTRTRSSTASSPICWSTSRRPSTAACASEGAVAERIGAALAGKYGVIARAIEGSPHAGEILDAHHRFAPRVAAFDQRVESEVAAALAKAGVADAAALARIVIGAAGGVARALPGAEATERAIRLVCLRLIEPATRG